MYDSLENPNIVWGHILTNPFLEKFYWELKKLTKLF